MSREIKLESMLMTLFTLAPNVKQKHWNEIYDQYQNLESTININKKPSPDQPTNSGTLPSYEDVMKYVYADGKCPRVKDTYDAIKKLGNFKE